MKIRRLIKVDALYLFHQEENPSIDSLSLRDLESISDFDDLHMWEAEDKKKIEQMLVQNPDKYLPIINANDVRQRAQRMHYQMNEINGDIYSPRDLEYRVFAESLDRFDDVEKENVNPTLILVNIYVGTGYDPEVISKVNQFAQTKEIPIVIYAPEGRDRDASSKFDQIKKEWNASCGFVAGDVQ